MSVSTVQPIRKAVVVSAPQASAFHLFTEGMGRWWNPDYHIGGEPFAAVVVEPREGGRWYERGASGAECQWGRVLAWDPPELVVLDWQISGSWQFDGDLHTELDVRFVPLGPSETRVHLEHRGLEAFGEQADAIRAVFDSPGGWLGVLERFVRGSTDDR